MNEVSLKSILTVSLLISSSALCENLLAETHWSTCDVATPATNRPDNTGNSPDAVYLEADDGTINAKGVSSLNGNASISQNDVSLLADNVQFDRRTDHIAATGNVQLFAKDLEVSADTIDYALNAGTGSMKNAQYQLNNSTANGVSTNIDIKSKELTELDNATFTTCSPNNPSWDFAAGRIKLNHKFKVGVAENITFRVGRVPIAYIPYLSFPLDNRRKTGFLSPSLSTTDASGLELTLPYYFNLAPNYDLTLSPGLTSKGGFKLGTEFRYLTNKSEGKIVADIVPNDSEYDGRLRGLSSIKHKTQITDNTRFTIDAQDVSDNDYFDDFSITLNEASVAALTRRADLTSKQGSWFLSGSIQDYQILDSDNAPYSRLPELRAKYEPETQADQIKYSVEGEAVYFSKDGSTNGTRTDIYAHASKRFGSYSWYVKPAIGLRQTYYSLEDKQASVSRFLPTLSVDSGMFFDRSVANGRYKNTLEPRLFYAYTPYKDQSGIPLFDSAATSFGTSSKLFSANRFTGKDRIGDTNQLTAAVTSRLIDTTEGSELVTASIGQIFYFADRKVTIGDEGIGTAFNSELAIELTAWVNKKTKIVAATYWDNEENASSSSELRLHYQGDNKKTFNASYRYLADEVKQAELSFASPINDRVSLIGKIEHDFERGRNLEALAGVEYGSCCWKARLAGRQFLTSDNETYDTGVFLEFELKGLGNIGNGAQSLFEEKIYGYKD